MKEPIEVQPGQVWQDKDPQGPTFQVVSVDVSYANVTDLQGKRPRRILLNGFRRYRLLP